MNTTAFLNMVAGNVFGTKTTPALPTKYYLGLSSTAPSLDGTGVTEPATSAGYQRVELTNLSEPTDGVVVNNQSVDFEESTSSWGTMTYFVVYGAQTDGDLLMYGQLPSSRTVDAGTIMTIKAGSLKLSAINPT